METNDQDYLVSQLIQLRVEHRDLDSAIMALTESVAPDSLQLQRMKKRRLQLKDYISRLESRLIPDIDA